MPKKKSKIPIRHAVYVSDTHCGCGLGLCPEFVMMDDGGTYNRSKFQQILGNYWDEFWGEWVPEVTKDEPFFVIHNGDAIDGVHHNSVTQITNNLAVQADIAYEMLAPVVRQCEGRYYHIRGTEAHVGKSAQEEERLAQRLEAIPNEIGQSARYDLWLRLGGGLVHSLHHIGTTGSQAYEATAVHKELTEHFIEAARWNQEPPSLIVRSHRHRCIEISIPTGNVLAHAIVTPAWQGRTPFAWKIPGARLASPQFGGIVATWTEDGNFIYTRKKVWTVERSREVSGNE
jgi:hypothetical protein